MNTYNSEDLAIELAQMKEYKEVNSKAIALQKKIMEMLPEEGKKLFLQYDEVISDLCNYENKFYFEKGIEMSNATMGENIINK